MDFVTHFSYSFLIYDDNLCGFKTSNNHWHHSFPYKFWMELPASSSTQVSTVRRKGVTLSTCVDGFLFGACCLLKEDSIKIIDDDFFINSTNSNEYQVKNESKFNSSQFVTDIDIENLSPNSDLSEEITHAVFSLSSSKDIQGILSTSLSDLLFNNEITSSASMENFETAEESTSIKNPLNREDNIDQVNFSPYNALTLSKSSPTEPTYLTQPIVSKEVMVISKESISENNTESDNIKDIYNFINPANLSYNELSTESRDQQTAFNNLEVNIHENKTINSTDYFSTDSYEEYFNNTEENALSELSTADSTISLENLMYENKNLSTKEVIKFDSNKELLSDFIPGVNIDHTDTHIYPKSVGSTIGLSSKINYSHNPEVENNTIKYEILNEESDLIKTVNGTIFAKNVQTTFVQKVATITNAFEVSTRNINFEFESTDFTIDLPPNSLTYSISDNSPNPEKMHAIENSSTYADDTEEKKFKDQGHLSKSPSGTTTSFNSNSSVSVLELTSNQKKTTQIAFPTLPWSSNSILPESVQSVISQLTVPEISSPAEWNLNYETQAPPVIGTNTLSTQDLFLDAEKSTIFEFVRNNNSRPFDKEEGNYTSNEINQIKVFMSDNFIKTSATDSIHVSNSTKLNEEEKILYNTNSLAEDISKKEFSSKLSTIPYTNNFPDLILDEHLHNKTILQTTIDSTNESENEQILVDKSSVYFPNSSTSNHITIKPLKSDTLSNSAVQNQKIHVSLENELKISPTAFADYTSDYLDSEEEYNATTVQSLQQNYDDGQNFVSPVQSSLKDNSSFTVTEITNTWTDKTMPENSNSDSPTVFQIINNHTGKNLSDDNVSYKVKDSNESHVNSNIVQPTEAETIGNITILSTENSTIESNSDLYHKSTLMNILYPTLQITEENIQSRYPPIHSTANPFTSPSYNESEDSSQNISHGPTSSYTDFSSTNYFSPISIKNETSLFMTYVEAGTTNTELYSVDSNQQNSLNLDFKTTKNENMDKDDHDPYHLILTENNNFTGYGNYTEENTESSLYSGTNTESTNMQLLELTSESYSFTVSDMHTMSIEDDFGIPLHTTQGEEILESVTESKLTNSYSTLSNMDSFSTSQFIRPSEISTSDASNTATSPDTVSHNFLTNSFETDLMTFDSELYLNTSFENSSNNFEENSIISTNEMLVLATMNVSSTAFTSQDKESTTVDNLVDHSTEASTKPTSTTTTVSKTDINRWNYKKDCGVRLMQAVGRIVGGKSTYFGKWPWQALVKEATWLGLFVKNKCGGVLINSKYVLTAAHCQPGFLASLLVVLGTHDLAETFDNKASVIRNVKRMVVHRHYNAQTFENDLALLEMESSVEFLPYVVPICLPHRNEDFTGNMAFVTGWGKLTHGGDVPNILQEVQVPIVSNGDCQRMFYHAGHNKAIRSNFVCAGYSNGGQDSCEGDSGGPLMVQREDKRWVLVGTVSHGIGCADPNLPGVYMRMSSYRPWIDSIIYK
ncbi:serine protease filzig [Nephila pilipes]|uniref:Serine protease filzig n=1 Tax=Nephila pilipes TaxID=299642 RepID=A0A8X6Q8A8_NEPPI|nr:serine protease filzig [Nephila pilipes]